MNEKLVENHFKFGENWEKLVATISDDGLRSAIEDLSGFLGTDTLQGKSFLDIGCGSGLHSLAAYKMGASSIISLDIDPKNVTNVQNIKRKFQVPSTAAWTEGLLSIVEADQVKKLKPADIVYSWGVLHHTGDMWNAIRNAASLVKPGGQFYIMLYRDSHLAGMWKFIKRVYTFSPSPVQFLLRILYAGMLLTALALSGRNPARVVRDYGKKMRGMTWYVDVVDWLGGYPFEYCSAEECIDFLKPMGFKLTKIYPEISPRQLGLKGTGSYTFLFERAK